MIVTLATAALLSFAWFMVGWSIATSKVHRALLRSAGACHRFVSEGHAPDAVKCGVALGHAVTGNTIADSLRRPWSKATVYDIDSTVADG